MQSRAVGIDSRTRGTRDEDVVSVGDGLRIVAVHTTHSGHREGTQLGEGAGIHAGNGRRTDGVQDAVAVRRTHPSFGEVKVGDRPGRVVTNQSAEVSRGVGVSVGVRAVSEDSGVEAGEVQPHIGVGQQSTG